MRRVLNGLLALGGLLGIAVVSAAVTRGTQPGKAQDAMIIVTNANGNYSQQYQQCQLQGQSR